MEPLAVLPCAGSRQHKCKIYTSTKKIRAIQPSLGGVQCVGAHYAGAHHTGARYVGAQYAGAQYVGAGSPP